MTTYRRNAKICSVCGAESIHHVLQSTNTFGDGPDLDGRPGEMMRSTMGMWVQECPVCGVVACDLEEDGPVTAQWLKQKSYRTCDGIQFASDLAKRFYRYYKILDFEGDHEASFHQVLCAAWACDDVGDKENAQHCRLLALEALDKIKQLMEEWKCAEDLWLVKVDLLRRTGQFEKAIELSDSISLSDDFLNGLLWFEADLARKKDSACYCADDVPDLRKESSCERVPEGAVISAEEWTEFLGKCFESGNVED